MVNRAETGAGSRHPAAGEKIRKHIVLTGILQGIGCRPTVFRLAVRVGLAGWIINTTSEVIIEIEGTPDQCACFMSELPEAIPHPGRIDSVSERLITPLAEQTFRIKKSLHGDRTVTPIPPDVAVCSECVEELFDPGNPRYLYPFITCTLCGPRFTVVRSFPYDRERTSMVDFTMCDRCREEYEIPDNRRFHSQTNSCPDCGPRLTLTDARGNSVHGDPMVEAIRLLMGGKTIGVKGIGGFHLACNALDESAIRLLRERKGRAEKPFAVMMPDLETIRQYCSLDKEEEKLLLSPSAPIVLCKAEGERLAASVAPLIGTLGVMLPYSPVHHLLFRHPELNFDSRPTALVMTSGNRAEEPIVRDNDEALERLSDLVDAFLFHNREIVLRADDSIFRVIAGHPTVFRRSRGLVPGEFKLEQSSPELVTSQQLPDRSHKPGGRPDPVVLAAGGDLKSALAIVKGAQVVPGPHVGDLSTPVAQEYFKQSIQVLTEYLDAAPEIVAVDPHPEYFSQMMGREIPSEVDEVFHHHAHAVSLLFQSGLQGPALFAVFDGTGYGTDGTIWGGEFLLADSEGFSRLAHIGLFPLPGGEAAIREPLRILAGLLAMPGAGVLPEELLSLFSETEGRHRLWIEAIRKNINTPLTSSAGRLFDAAAAAIGFRRQVTFEGEAAMWLEGITDRTEPHRYKVALIDGEPLIIDPAALILEVARDILDGVTAEKVAARFHNTVAGMIAETLGRLSKRTGINAVGLSGGCFQNKLLTERTAALLEKAGYRVLLHETVPPNDGGIALGQAVAARARWRRRQG